MLDDFLRRLHMTVRSNVRQKAVAHGLAVLCVFKFSQVV